jgi:hypothetical protein
MGPANNLACSVNDTAFPATNCSRWPRGHGPNPGLRTRARRAGQRWLVGCPLDLDPPATPPSRRLIEQERQP